MKIITPNHYIVCLAIITLAMSLNISIAQLPSNKIAILDKNIPVTNFPFNDSKNKLEFAIVSDLWGGYRPGIFEDAISKIELLQPQLVMSVGDLIDGNSLDSTVILNQWDEFNNKLKPLSIPFFYVPGNHDIGSPMMERQWHTKIGKPYYYFIYKNALFLCINTEDGGRSGISDDQVVYFKNSIENHPDVRWTFIFMHRPVWFTDNDKQEGYEKIEAALNGHDYTLFSGHHHTYLSKSKKGNQHYILGSTGGGSDLRGEKFGEFDHITWVTLNDGEKPKIINLKLDGLVKENIANEKTYPITNTLINEDWLITSPYILNEQKVNLIKSTFTFNNPTSYPLQVSGAMLDLSNYSFSPKYINLTVPGNSKIIQPFQIKDSKNELIDISKCTSFDVSFDGTYYYDSIKYSLPAKKQLNFNWQHRIKKSKDAKAKALKQFDLTDTSGFYTIEFPEFLKNKWYWSGSEDSYLGFKILHDSKDLYMIVFIEDDQIVLDSKTDQRDLVYFDIEDKNEGKAQFSIIPGQNKMELRSMNSGSFLNTKDFQTTIETESNRIKILFKISKDKILKADNSFRFNIGYFDQDNYPEKRYSILYYKPIWGSETDYINSGSFILDSDL